jgi:hypothetical protein
MSWDGDRFVLDERLSRSLRVASRCVVDVVLCTGESRISTRARRDRC